MSIIQSYRNGETNLNKLKFKPNMDKGDPPLITKRIPTGENPSAPPSSDLRTRTSDLARISKLMVRKEGLQFLGNNTLLNTAVENSYSSPGTIKDKIDQIKNSTLSGLQDTVNTLASTLAQVPLTGTGTHFIKGNLFRKPESKFNRLKAPIAAFGNPGATSVRYSTENRYTKSTGYGTDLVNMEAPYRDSQPRKDLDLVKFLIEVVRPKRGSTFLSFRAYIDSFNDNFNANWNAVNYIGRGETLYSYGGFNRNMSVNFKSAVASKVELKPVYQKLVWLASTTAPRYSDDGIMQGTFVKISIGDYIADMPAVINSVAYNWSTSYPFEVALGKKDEQASKDPILNSDLTTQQLPHVLDCSLSFTPIHKFTPQTGYYHYLTNPEGDSAFFTEGQEAEFGRQASVEVGQHKIESENNVLSQQTIDNYNNALQFLKFI